MAPHTSQCSWLNKHLHRVSRRQTGLITRALTLPLPNTAATGCFVPLQRTSELQINYSFLLPPIGDLQKVEHTQSRTKNRMTCGQKNIKLSVIDKVSDSQVRCVTWPRSSTIVIEAAVAQWLELQVAKYNMRVKVLIQLLPF